MNGAISTSPGSISPPIQTATHHTPLPPLSPQPQPQPQPTSPLHPELIHPAEQPSTDGVLRPSSPGRPTPTARPPLPSSPRRPSRPRQSAVVLPSELLHPGIEMLKVSAKSARRVKPRRVWLQTAAGGGAEAGGAAGAGPSVREAGEVSICWEKSGRAVGAKRQASIPLSTIRELRFGTSGSPYRTSLHLSPALEPRWLTLIYHLPPGSRPANPLAAAPTFKLVHLIAPNARVLQLWKDVLERLLGEGRVNGTGGAGIVALPGNATDGESSGGEERATRVVREGEVQALVKRLGMGIGRDEVGAAFRKAAAPLEHLDFPAFQQFVRLLKQRKEIDHIFTSLVPDRAEGLDLAAWTTFVRGTQKMALADEAVARLHAKFAGEGPVVGREGFASFLMSSDNPALEDDSQQDMTRPLAEYFISSSHNTYLVGNQFRGESTIEGYIRALQQGCRSVELDVWDGDNHSPVITHGRTLTSSIPVRDVLEAINTYAFLASPYPIILSFEIHCGVEQQDELAKALVDVLGDRLVREQIDGKTDDIHQLPSPEELRGKVIVKAKNLFLVQERASREGSGSSYGAVLSGEDEIESSSSASSDSDFKRVLNAVKRTFDERRPALLGIKSSSRVVSATNSTPASTPSPAGSSFPQPADRTLSFSDSSSLAPSSLSVPSAATKQPMSRALAALLVYTIGVKHRGFNKKETYHITHVISFGESRLAKLCAQPDSRQDLLAHCRTHLVRAYPKGSRLTSTNYLPHQWWAAGVQMVSVNWQTWDLGMEMNAAMFARAGRSGYVLKPELLRRKEKGEKDKETWKKVKRYELRLEVLSGYQLPRGSGEGEGSTLDPFVEVSLFAPGTAGVVKRRTKCVIGNAFNPIFGGSIAIPFEAHPSAGMLDLVFVRLEVLTAKDKDDLRPWRAGSNEPFDDKGDSVGAFVVGLGALKPGYRHLPLYDAMGDQHLHSSLLIKSEVVEVGGGSPLLVPGQVAAGAAGTGLRPEGVSVAPGRAASASSGKPFWRRSSSSSRSREPSGSGEGGSGGVSG